MLQISRRRSFEICAGRRASIAKACRGINARKCRTLKRFPDSECIPKTIRCIQRTIPTNILNIWRICRAVYSTALTIEAFVAAALVLRCLSWASDNTKRNVHDSGIGERSKKPRKAEDGGGAECFARAQPRGWKSGTVGAVRIVLGFQRQAVALLD